MTVHVQARGRRAVLRRADFSPDAQRLKLVVQRSLSGQNALPRFLDREPRAVTAVNNVNLAPEKSRNVEVGAIQSMVRDDGQRTLLFDLDLAIQRLAGDLPDHPSLLQLTGVYHNLLRKWAEL